jgi:hypothetical protein
VLALVNYNHKTIKQCNKKNKKTSKNVTIYQANIDIPTNTAFILFCIVLSILNVTAQNSGNL